MVAWRGFVSRANRVPYRQTLSVVNLCLKKTAEMDGGWNSEVANVIKRNMYVDDPMKSTETTADAILLVHKVKEQLSKDGFHLTKWCSNDRRVLAVVPQPERAKSVINLELDLLPTQSALGLKWDIEDDKFVWEVADKLMSATSKVPLTKRGMVSVVYSLFDPLGFIAPYIMKAKLLLQTLNGKGIGWDELVTDAECLQWERWIDDLDKLREVKIDQCFKPEGFGKVQETQLHLFSDASRKGYSATAYLRLKDITGKIHCSFVIGKARLAPIKETSIPRLELTAAVISCETQPCNP